MAATEAILNQRLSEFLAKRGAEELDLLADVDPAFGEPLLIVATGSVLHGFGNARSDLDVNVVVDHADLSTLSFPSFERGFLLDTLYFSATDVATWVEHSRDGHWPPVGRLDRRGWQRRAKELVSAVRFGHGLPLRATDEWGEWLGDLRKPWLSERVVEWWRTEAQRRRLAARWLAVDRPQLASQQWCDAALAALEARAAASGELFFGTKWLPEKFRRLDDAAGMRAIRAALTVPVEPGSAATHLARCDELVDEFAGAPAGLAVQLWDAPGVRRRVLRTSTLVSRHDLRAVEVTGFTLPDAGDGEPLWTGRVDERPPEAVHRLFVEDMTWMTLVREQA